MKSFIIAIAVIVSVEILYMYFWPTDSTDKSKWRRSGMSVYTDHATGVQYIKVGFGGLTPRLHADGSLYVIDQK